MYECFEYISYIHDDVFEGNHVPRYWPFVWGIRRDVNSTHKGQWQGALMFSLICAWTNGWANNLGVGDLRHLRAHYGATVMVARKMSKLPHRTIHHWDKQYFMIIPDSTVGKHYGDVIIGTMASQITSLTIVYSTVHSGADQRKHQSTASLAFVPVKNVYGYQYLSVLPWKNMETQSEETHGVILHLILKTISLNFAYLILLEKIRIVYL